MEEVTKATAAEDSENCGSGETMGSNASLDGSRRKEAPAAAESGANPKEYQRSKSHNLSLTPRYINTYNR